MEVKWYCRIRDKQFGPYRWAELQQLAGRGELTAHALVRRSDETTWIEARHVQGLLPSPSGGPPPPPLSPTTSPASPPGDGSVKSAEAADGSLLNPPAPPNLDRPTARPAAPARSGRSVVAKPLPPVPPSPSSVGRSAPPVVPPPPGHTRGSAPALPVGTAVAAPAPTSAESDLETVREARAVGVTHRGKPSSPTSVIVSGAETPAGGAPPSAQIRDQRRKAARIKLLLMIGGTIAVSLVVVVVGLLVAWHNGSFSTATPTNLPSTVRQDSEISLPANDVAGTAGGGEAASAQKPDSTADSARTAARVAEGADKNAARDKIVDSVVRSIARWRDASTVSGVSTGTARLQIVGAWLSNGDESKESDDADDESARPPVTARRSGSAKGRPALCIEVRVTCLPHAELGITYNSWNLTGSGGSHPSILLVDQANRPYDLLSVEQWSDEARQATARRLRPGQAVTDLLVFPLPDDREFEFVRLAVKMSALSQGDRYLGFHFARDQIAPSKPEAVADNQGAARATASNAASADAKEETEAPEPAAKPAPPAVPAENDIEQLKRQIEASAKAAREAREKERKEEDQRNQGKNN